MIPRQISEDSSPLFTRCVSHVVLVQTRGLPSLGSQMKCKNDDRMNHPYPSQRSTDTSQLPTRKSPPSRTHILPTNPIPIPPPILPAQTPRTPPLPLPIPPLPLP